MKFSLKRAFESILRWGEQADQEGDLPVSMVLLLRASRFPTLDQLRSAGERAFGTPFTDDKESRHFVVQVALFTIMKAGRHTLSFLNYTKPYGEGDFPQEFGRLLPKASQRQAWAEHTAWTAVDYVKGGVDLELEYAVLATLCAELLDANCVGLYIPREQNFIPNDGSLMGDCSAWPCHAPLASRRIVHRIRHDLNGKHCW
jgi:hypothetical protein